MAARNGMSNGVADPTPDFVGDQLEKLGVDVSRPKDTTEARHKRLDWLYALWESVKPMDGVPFFCSESWRGDGLTFETLTGFRAWLSPLTGESEDSLKDDTEQARRLFGDPDDKVERLGLTLEQARQLTTHNKWLLTYDKKACSWKKKRKVGRNGNLVFEALDNIASYVAKSGVSSYTEAAKEWNNRFNPPAVAPVDDTPPEKDVPLTDILDDLIEKVELDGFPIESAIKALEALSEEDLSTVLERFTVETE